MLFWIWLTLGQYFMLEKGIESLLVEASLKDCKCNVAIYHHG
jgi:hypothetical protein